METLLVENFHPTLTENLFFCYWQNPLSSHPYMKPSKFFSKLQYSPHQFITCTPIQRVKAVKRLDASLWSVRLNSVIANVFNGHIFLKDVSVLIRSFIPWRLRKILYGHRSASKMENVSIYFCTMSCKRILSQRVEREPQSLQVLHMCISSLTDISYSANATKERHDVELKVWKRVHRFALGGEVNMRIMLVIRTPCWGIGWGPSRRLEALWTARLSMVLGLLGMSLGSPEIEDTCIFMWE